MNDEHSNENLFLGKAGESFVAAHLLRLGFNASPLPVDVGVDLLAHRVIWAAEEMVQAHHEIYQFQVKTTTTSEYRASLPVAKVQNLWNKAINMVVVFWSHAREPQALVLPPSLLRMLSSGGFEDPNAPLIVTGDLVSLRFIFHGGRCFLRNRNHDVTEMLNRFDRVEPADVDTSSFPPYALWADDGKALVQIEPDQHNR